MRRAAAALLLFGLGTTVLMAKPKIQIQSKPDFNYAGLQTWAWNPGGPGDVKIWVTKDSKSEPVKRQYEPVLMKAVEDELTKIGLAKASGAAPDFLVTYYMLVTVGSSEHYAGQFLPNVTEWGLPPFTAQTTALSVYPMGTLVLDVASPDVDHVVWRAVAQAEIDLDKTEAQRAVRIKNVVHDILAKLPRKNKK